MLNSMYTNLNAVNNTISKLGGAQLTNDNEHIWSSSEWDKQNAWYFRTLGNANSGGIWGGSKANGMTIRPVLAF